MLAASAILAEAGFDLVHAFDARTCARVRGWDVLDDSARPRGLLIGNTRALWPRFLAARAADAELAAASDPLERYTEAALARVVAQLPGARVWLAHRHYPAGGAAAEAYLPFQRLAVATGLGTLSATQLVIHPTYGPWFALRAVIACAGEPPPARAATAPPCTCDAACGGAFSRALGATGPEAWREWLAVRDACPIGRAFRYDDDQIAYHYTKNRGLLASTRARAASQ
jgi:hypothetical protein